MEEKPDFRLLDEEVSRSNSDLIDPPIQKKLGPAVVTLQNVKKYYTLDGNDEPVKALDGVTLSPESEFYPVMIIFVCFVFCFELVCDIGSSG
jgi:hypothetical protein